MNNIKHKKIISFILSTCIILSGLFFDVVNTQASSYGDYKSSYSSFSMPDALPASVTNSKGRTESASVRVRPKTNYYNLGGVGSICSLSAYVLNSIYCPSFWIMVSNGLCEKQYSHTIILDYIHHKDGKK